MNSLVGSNSHSLFKVVLLILKLIYNMFQVFMQFFSWMLAQYRCCLIVVRSHPKPVIVFNDKRFLEIRSFQVKFV